MSKDSILQIEGPDSFTLDDLPLERLETEITTLAGQISAATCRLLLAIAAYDRRAGWESWGCRSMCHWLSWRTGMSAPTAREHVRVGHALEGLPTLQATFGRGELSYSQVRAVTRIAVASTEISLVELARSMTASQLDRVVARYRSVKAVTIETAQQRWARRGMHSYLDDDGMRVTVIRQPPEDGERMLRAVDAVVKAFARDRDRAEPAPEPGLDPEIESSLAACRADALAEIIAGATTGDDGGASSSATEAARGVLVVLHTQPEVLRGEERSGMCHVEDGPGISAETAQRLGCDADSIVSIDAADGSSTFGRRSRRVPLTMRRALRLRDQACVFPGCDVRKGTDAHHVQPWAKGGPTTLRNLALLCRFHHHRVHEGGYKMRSVARPGRPHQGWRFFRPDGTPIPSVSELPTRCDGLPAACNDIEPDACLPSWDGTGVDQAWVIESLLQAEGLLRDAPVPSSGATDGSTGAASDVTSDGSGDAESSASSDMARDGLGGERSGDHGSRSDDRVSPPGAPGAPVGFPRAGGVAVTIEAGGGSGSQVRRPERSDAWPGPWPTPWRSAWLAPWPNHRDDGST